MESLIFDVESSQYWELGNGFGSSLFSEPRTLTILRAMFTPFTKGAHGNLYLVTTTHFQMRNDSTLANGVLEVLPLSRSSFNLRVEVALDTSTTEIC
jgi:hypothetical protein